MKFKEALKRVRVDKDEGIFGTLVYRKISRLITASLANTKIGPIPINISSFVIGLIAALFFAFGEYRFLIIGGILTFLSYLLDNVDGETARLKNMVTSKGGFLDASFDRTIEGVLILGICFGIYSQTANPIIGLYGIIALIGIYMSEMIPMMANRYFEKGTLAKEHSKLFLAGIFEKLRIKKSFLTLGVDFRFSIIAIGAVLNQLIIVLWFFMIIQNLYWIMILLTIAFRKEQITIKNKKKADNKR